MLEALAPKRGTMRSSFQNMAGPAAVKSSPLRVFLSYASEDRAAVQALRFRLEAEGVDTWMDQADLLPGQNWEIEINDAVRSSDAVIVIVSQQTGIKIGYVQKEIRFILRAAEEQPPGAIFVIPVKTEACEVPGYLGDLHWANLYEPDGFERLMVALRQRASALGKASPASGAEVQSPSPPPPKPAGSINSTWNSRRTWLIGVPCGVIGLGVAAYIGYKPSQEMASIAVLPFRPLDPSDSAPHVGLGLTDALINKLAALNKIIVRPTSSVVRFLASDQDPTNIGRELKVDTILDGRLQRGLGRLRLSVQLVGVRSGALIWAAKFEQVERTIFEVQDSVAQQVAAVLLKQLGKNVSDSDARKLLKRSTVNLEAYELYTKGQFEYYKRTHEGFRAALVYFQQAVTLDPKYALPWAAIAMCHVAQSGTRAPKSAFPSASEAALKALALDEDLPEAHRALALVHFHFDWNWSQAEDRFQRSVSLDPNSARSRAAYGQFLMVMGRFSEAIAELTAARRVEPNSVATSMMLGLTYHLMRDYARAVSILRETIEQFPGAATPREYLSAVYIQQSRIEEALTAAQEAQRLSPGDAAILSQSGQAMALAGRREEAADVITKLQELMRIRYVSPSVVADVHLALGDTTAALEWLKKAYDDRAWQLLFLKVDPKYNRLRSEPEFLDLLVKIGL